MPDTLPEISAPVTIAAPSRTEKGERVRAQQEAAGTNDDLLTGGSGGGAILAHLSDANVLAGYGPGKRLDFDFKGRTFTLRPYAFADMDAVGDALNACPLFFTAVAQAAPDKRFADLTAEDVTDALNALTSAENAVTPDEAPKIQASLFRTVDGAGRQAMLDVVFYALKREEDDAGRDFEPSDIAGIVDFATFPVLLRLIYQKNGWTEAVSPDLQFGS